MHRSTQGRPGCRTGLRRRINPAQLRSCLRAFASADSGQATVLVAVCMIVLLLFLGLVLDVGSMRMSKVRLQSAADAAAIAAGLEISQCAGTANCPAMQTAALSSLQENGYTSVTVNTNCGTPGSTTQVSLTVNNPPCALGSSDPNSGKQTAAEVVISGPVPLSFAKLAGFNLTTVTVRAEAARPTNPPCVYALDPHGAGAISFVAGVAVNFNCGLIDESDSSAALTCLVGLGISAPSVKVTGGAAGLLCGIPNLKVNSPRPQPTDPLNYLPTPAIGSCGYSSGNTYYGSSSNVTIALGGTYTFNPGVYCGGISITASVAANITFNPGVYILKTGPGTLGLPTGGLNITLSALANITGNGVTFYNAGTIGGYSVAAASPLGLSNVSLTAPTSGDYAGVLFMQDPSNTFPASFTANLLSASKIEGAYYIPNAPLTYAVSAVASNYNIIVAKDVYFAVAVGATFGNDYSTLSAGSPINRLQAVLVQ